MSKTKRVEWINHNGKRILVADYSNLTGQDVIDVFLEGKVNMIEEGSNVLAVGVFTGTKIDSDFMSAAKEAGKELDDVMKKTAVIGMTGIQKIFYNGYIQVTGQRKKSKLFDTVDESLDWLTED